MAQCAVIVDSLTQFTADLIRFTAAETRYHEFLCRGGGGGGVGVEVEGCPQMVPSPSSKSVPNKPKSISPPQSQANASKNGDTNARGGLSALSQQIAIAREQIASSLRSNSKHSSSSGGVVPSEEDAMIREENLRLKQQLEVLQAQVNKLTDRVSQLEIRLTDSSSAGGGDVAKKPAAPAPPDGEDDVDLFGSDDEEEDEAAQKIKEQRLAEYAAKKTNKPTIIAKSNVILDVKPWDDETDMKELEKGVRSIVMDGLLWGVSKLVPVGYGIMKLQIATVIEDDKVSVDDLIEKIQENEDFVQSVDIAAFNKI